MQRPIYCDHQATTPVDRRVLAAMEPYWTDMFGNPGSGHRYGWEAAAAVDRSRTSLAQFANATPEGVIFTSGATEANNLAIKGIAEAHLERGRHLVSVVTEHAAVLDPLRYLERLGFEVTLLPVQPDGLLDLDRLRAALRPDTILVSVMAANNEIGVLQPLAEIGTLLQQSDPKPFFHVDAAQALGKIPLDMQAMGIDLLSLTAHKIYGPKGIGALVVQAGIDLAAQLHGGGQEQQRRAGTLYVAQIVGFATAVEIATPQAQTELLALRTFLWQQLQNLDGVTLNGAWQPRLAGNLNVSFEDVPGNSLLSAIRETVAVSSGSACSAGKPSHVLKALGRSAAEIQASVRFGLGRGMTRAECEQIVAAVTTAVHQLRP